MSRALDVGTSFAASVMRLGAGMEVVPLGPRPERPLELFEFESCPFCRKVREALSMLDLDAQVYPCPKGGPRYRPRAIAHGGKAQFPYLIDPNTGVALYESDEIVRYLFATYGAGTPPWSLSLGVLTDLASGLASAMRIGSGTTYRRAREPKAPLELWSFEASPFCRIAREALCTLEIPYLLHNVAKGSPKRETFERRAGKMQVPYLVDANTGVALFESAEIVHYLETTYAR